MSDETVPKHQAGRIIAIDYGMVRIGIAISDERKIIAMPLKIITVDKGSVKTVAKIVQELTSHQEQNRYVIEEIVIGLPLLLSGKQGLLADEVKHFAELLSKSCPFPITLWDERLTTVQAERSMRESGMSRKKRAKVVDTVAAVIILQNYLDHRQIKKGYELRELQN